MRTRSGRNFSPTRLATALAECAAEFVATEERPADPSQDTRIPVSQKLSPLVQAAVDTANERELADADDAEGLPLSYGSDFSSPLSSAPPSRCASPPSEEHLRSQSPNLGITVCSTPAEPPVPPKTKLRRRSHKRKRQAAAAPSSSSDSAASPRSSSLQPNPTACDSRPLSGFAARRKRKRMEKSLARVPGDYKIHPSLAERHQHFDSVKADFNLKNLPAAQGAHIGLRRRIIPVSPALTALLNDNFKLVKWDGRTPKAIVDETSKVFAYLAGRPQNDPTWDGVLEGAEAAIKKARELLVFGPTQLSDRRGRFPTFAYGISYGGGQTRPGNLAHDEHNKQVLEELHSDPCIVRLMRYAEGVVAFQFPKLWREYADNMTALLNKHPHLKPVLPGGVFAATSTNFGPNVVSYEHEDFGNKANGVCPIYSFGKFDPTRGGHLVLRQLKLVIEFPPGSLILIPSATLTHGNTPIAHDEGEYRLSFTQYAAGGLFRWVQYGFRTWPQFLAADKAAAKAEEAKRPYRWLEALEMFSHVDRLHADRVAAGLVDAKKK